jgi:putative peptidoglycan lipid II flippase
VSAGTATTGDTRREAVARPAALVSVATLGSRIAGLARESLFAALFGASHLADAYQVAFRIPNLLRDLFAEGALSSAFVPAYSRIRRERGEAEALSLARRVLGTLLVVTGAVALLGILFAPAVVDVVAAGADAARRATAVPLTRIMFPFLPLVAIAAVLMGVLNAHGRYLVPAWAPVAFNVVTILGGLGLLALGWSAEAAITGWAVMVVVGGLAQVLVQVPSARAVGLRGPPRPDPAFRDPDLRAVVRRMGPVALALAGTQVMIVVTTAVASREEGWVAALQYAFRLIHLPIGLVGVALGTVALAAASRRAAEGDSIGLDDVLRRGLRLNLLLAVPSAAGLVALAEPLVRLVYERGAFDAATTALVASAVRWYAIGVPMYAGVKVAAAAFHARGNTRAPMTASLAGIAVNLGIAVVGVSMWGFIALPLATALGTAVNYGLLRVLDGRRHGPGAAPGIAVQWRILLLSAVMAAGVYGVASTWLARDGILGHGVLLLVGTLGLSFVAGVLYLLAAHVVKIEEAGGLVRAVGRRLRRGTPTPP